MSSNNDSISKTLIVVISLCLVCAVIVSTAAVQLRPQQSANKLLDSQTNVLKAVGMLEPGKDVRTLFNNHIKIRLVNLETGDYVERDPQSFDYRKAMKDPELSRPLPAADDTASIKRLSKIAPVFLAYKDGVEAGGKPDYIVMPIHGYGLWSTMHAFLAVETDGNTVVGLNYYEHGETPGLGGEIESPKFKNAFVGKKLYNDQGEPAISVVKPGNAGDSDYKVDGLSGATLTSNGVQYTFEFWTGEQGFGPFLGKVRSGEF